MQIDKINRLDHGILNVPLSKRGNIDAQIDKYKKQEAKENRARLDNLKFEYDLNKQKAQEIWAQNKDQIIKKHGKKYGKKTLRESMEIQLKVNPKKFIKNMERLILDLKEDLC